MGTFVSKCFLVVCRQAPTITSLAVGASHKRRQQYLTQGLATWGGVLRAECWWNCFAQLASIRKLCAPGEMAEKRTIGIHAGCAGGRNGRRAHSTEPSPLA